MGREDARTVPSGFLVLQVGGPPRVLVEGVTAALSRRVDVACRLAEAPEGFPLPRLEHREQLDADAVLGHLERLPRDDGTWIVGVTHHDLGNPIFTFFFGRARHHGGAVLVSTARLAPAYYGLPDDVRVTTRRAVLETLHELGHAAGLGHCQDSACLMRFSPTVESLDNRGERFCPVCALELPDAFRPSR